MYVIGTAGHVDHGKSTLVRALTGIDPDRLREEKEREMTIDLGFAWLTLDGIEDEVGVVDVPGHRDFIENMLAGVGGIDLALFVVAADEGVMPQTREHLAILDLLRIRHGVVALTKVDLVDDPDWLELVTLDLHDTLDGTVLTDAPIVPISAQTGEGLTTLQRALAAGLAQCEVRVDKGRPRLPVDRVFSLSGFGTVVTGTLVGGRLRINDEVVVMPEGHAGRVRGLQTHKTKREIALPGSRVAVNVSGVDTSQIGRGAVLAAPGVVRSTILLDVSYRHLQDAGAPLKHNMPVKLFTGSAEIMARTRILGEKSIAPGADGFVQLALEAPVAVLRGDRFILRRPSPAATLGGGAILDPHPGRRHRRFRPETLARLRTLAQGTPEELLVQVVARTEPVTRSALLQQAGMARDSAETALDTALADGDLVELGQHVVTQTTWRRWADTALALTRAYHDAHPLRTGMPREEVRSRLRLKAAVFNPFLQQLVDAGELVQQGSVVRLPDHAIQFSAEQQRAIEILKRRFAAAGINAPSVKEARAAVGDAVYGALLQQGTLQQVSADVVWLTDDYEKFTDIVYTYLRQHGTINVAQVRDLLATSRKYAIGLLEHLDEIKLTRRVGDVRELTPQHR